MTTKRNNIFWFAYNILISFQQTDSASIMYYGLFWESVNHFLELPVGFFHNQPKR